MLLNLIRKLPGFCGNSRSASATHGGNAKEPAAELARLSAENAWLSDRVQAWERHGDPSYNHDYLTVWNKSLGFLRSERFMSAYRRGMESGHIIGRPHGSTDDIHIEWRIHTCCWAGAHAAKLEGAFVECGTNTGIMSLAVCEYVGFNQLDKNFWLFDTFAGMPEEQINDEERAAGRVSENNMYFDCYDIASRNFAPFPRVHLVRGRIPDTLSMAEIDKVAYLCIDMNILAPEEAALAHFWPKLVPGGVVIFDDYGWSGYRLQKESHDRFAAANGVEILELPTGQGLLIKP